VSLRDDGKMKIYLDDTRPAPKGWILVKNAPSAIKLLEEEEITEISLDHDLGDDLLGTGYTVLLWIEEKVYTSNYSSPVIHIHTSNTSAKSKMEQAVKSIQGANAWKKS